MPLEPAVVPLKTTANIARFSHLETYLSLTRKIRFRHQLLTSIFICYVCKTKHTHCAKNKTCTVWKETMQLTQAHIFTYLFLNVQTGSALQNAPGEYLFQVYVTSYVARWYSKRSFKMRYPRLLTSSLSPCGPINNRDEKTQRQAIQLNEEMFLRFRKHHHN